MSDHGIEYGDHRIWECSSELSFALSGQKANIKVKTIYRREEDRVGDTERELLYPEITFTTNIEDILQEDEIELIVVATHVDSHVEYAKLALEHGKHVLVEKPLPPLLRQPKIFLN